MEQEGKLKPENGGSESHFTTEEERILDLHLQNHESQLIAINASVALGKENALTSTLTAL